MRAGNIKRSPHLLISNWHVYRSNGTDDTSLLGPRHQVLGLVCLKSTLTLLPTTREGHVFRGVCQSFCLQGRSPSPLWTGIPGQRQPSGQRPPPPDRDPVWTQTPLQRPLCSGTPSLWTETPHGQTPLWSETISLWTETPCGTDTVLC